MALETCQCETCLCFNGTHDRRCALCVAGKHPGLPRKTSPGVPIPMHERMYSQTCSVCGAPPGKRCFRYQDRNDGEPPKNASGTIPHSKDLRGVATPSRPAQRKVKG